MGIAPAVPHKLQFLLCHCLHRSCCRDVKHQLLLLRNKFHPLLFVNLNQKFLQILLTAPDCWKRPVSRIMTGVTPLKYPVKFLWVKKCHRLLPAALRQIGKMEQIFYCTYGGIQNDMFYWNNKGKIIFPLITDNIKIALQHIPLFHVFPMECKWNFLIRAYKLLCKTFHP